MALRPEGAKPEPSFALERRVGVKQKRCVVGAQGG
jgi:hypothetical protein